MKICDRCFAKDGSPVQAVTEIEFTATHEKQDLCQSCNELVRNFISNFEVDLKCQHCSFVAKSEAGLKTHITMKHPDVVF